MVRAYQEVEPLTIGELWAIAISLRILLVENLRRLAEQIVRSRAARQKADELADACSASARTAPTSPPHAAPAHAHAAADGRARPAVPAAARPGPGGHTRRCAGSRSSSRRRGRPPRRWSASSTSARRR